MHRRLDANGRGACAGLFLDPAIASAIAVATALAIILPFLTLGGLSSHMLAHIVSMSIAAPLLAGGWQRWRPGGGVTSGQLWSSATLQILVLWAWHLPAAHHVASSPSGALLMHASLFSTAVWFWTCLVRLNLRQQWQGILALLVTGKLACLLAALLVLAPRPILAAHHHAAGALDDQHLAGLLMIAACPASYVLAGVLMAARIAGLAPASYPRG